VKVESVVSDNGMVQVKLNLTWLQLYKCVLLNGRFKPNTNSTHWYIDYVITSSWSCQRNIRTGILILAWN